MKLLDIFSSGFDAAEWEQKGYQLPKFDIADGTQRDFDELIFEQRGSVCWLHFAVRPENGDPNDERTRNRRGIAFDIR